VAKQQVSNTVNRLLSDRMGEKSVSQKQIHRVLRVRNIVCSLVYEFKVRNHEPRNAEAHNNMRKVKLEEWGGGKITK
jgi:hypothetical protein